MKSIFIAITVSFVSVVVPYASAQAGCHLPIRTPFSAVSLLKTNFLERLENENLLKKICPTQDKDCVTKALSTQTDEMPIYDSPSGKVIANLKITYTPGDKISATLAHGEKVLPFLPPIHDSDWGYGPWFHATLLDQNETWKNITLPSIQSGWIELPEAKPLQLTDKNRVYSLNDRHIVITRADTTSLTVRDEQPADMWCAEGYPPPLTSFKEQIIPLNQVYDDACNLLLTPAYTRGC